MSSEGDVNTTEVKQEEDTPTKEADAPEPDAPKEANIEKQQEAKLRAKYPSMALKGPGSSAFLQKRLSKGKQYFDSGDYNMAKAKKSGASKAPLSQKQKLLIPASTGETIPTPESVSHRKPSLVQSKLISS